MTLQVTTCVSSRRVSFILLVLLSVLVIITYSCYIAFIILPNNTPSTDPHNNNNSGNDTNNDNSSNNDEDNNSNSSSSNNLSSEYDPEVAWRGLHYCKAAYCSTEKLIDWSCGETCDEVRFFEPCFLYLNASFGTLGFAGLDHTHHKIVLAFRGSSNIANWIEDLSYWAIPYPSESCGPECMVHRGFYHSYMSLQPYVLMDMADLHVQYPSYTLLVTGHSLGAALALLSALDLATWNDMATNVRHEQLAKVNFVNVHENLNSNKDDINLVKHVSLRNTSHTTRSSSNLYDKKKIKNNNSSNISNIHYTFSDAYVAQSKSLNNSTKVTKEETQNRNIKTSRALAPIEVYTFGEPRVGDVHFSLWSTNVLSIHQQFRVTHGRDVVPHLPPQSSNYVHVPQELWYNNSYKDERECDDEDNINQSSNDHIESNVKIDRNNINKINNRGINRLTMKHIGDDKKDEENKIIARHNSNHSSLSYRICTDNASSEDYNCSNSVWSTSVSDHLLYIGVCTRCECTSKDMAEIESYELSDNMLEKLHSMRDMNTDVKVDDKMQEISVSYHLEEEFRSKTR